MTEPALLPEQLLQILEACPRPVFVSRLEIPGDDRSFRLIYANPAAERQTGVPRASIVGKSSEEGFPNLRERGFIDLFMRVIATGQPEPYEDNYYADEQLAAAFTGYVARIAPDMIAVWFENVTQRKQMELDAARAMALERESQERGALLQELEAAHRRAQSALDTYELVASAAEEALWEIDVATTDAPLSYSTPCRFSDRFAEMLGYTPGEIEQTIGTFGRVIHPDDLERVRQVFFASLTGPEGRFQCEYRMRTRSGGTIFVLVTARSRMDAQGRPCKVAGAIRDITQQKLAEAEMRERLALIERQQGLIEALSTPLLEVWDGVVALPIVGALDGRRAALATDELLRRIADKGTRFALVDLTGVETIDTSTAEHVVRIAQAVGLLGARAIITGIRPAVAQTIVDVGIDLASVETRRNLRDGLRECQEALSRERRAARHL
jgi:PAS domain S-box-containing protein